MKRQMRELQAKLADAEQEVRNHITAGETAKAENKMKEVRNIRNQIKMLEELGEEEQREINNAAPAGEKKDRDELAKAYKKAFVKAVRNKPLNADEQGIVRDYKAVMHSGDVTGEPDGDAGLIIPEDVQTRINELMRQFNDLSQYIRVETVNTASGSRVLELDEDMTPFAEVEEYGEIQKTDNPKFTPVTYKLVKRAGYLPLTGELLADSDQNILQYVIDWLARKGVVTKNTLITALLKGLTPDDLTGADIDKIKYVLNVELDPAISNTSMILTNQSGFHWLDTLKDDKGRYLLQDDITRPGQKMLLSRPIGVVSNRHLSNITEGDPEVTNAPFFIGNLAQTAVLFTRGRFALASTREGGEAWRRDSLELRAISRDDVRLWDTGAAKYGHITVEV
ncbi:MAG: phage major capsid protein [Firmicutes bacterium]|nr:phage major capsid protein [Bacillota bacterium]